MIFETERLIIRKLKEEDRDSWFDLMNNPNVMKPIPRPIMNKRESDEHFEKHLNLTSNKNTNVMAIDVKHGNSFIGIAAFLKNDNHEDEIGYRLREKFWGLGYGTETAKGLINYGFNNLRIQLLTADVNTENLKSVKILDFLFKRDYEFYNADDKCVDRRYKLTRKEWESRE